MEPPRSERARVQVPLSSQVARRWSRVYLRFHQGLRCGWNHLYRDRRGHVAARSRQGNQHREHGRNTESVHGSGAKHAEWESNRASVSQGRSFRGAAALSPPNLRLAESAPHANSLAFHHDAGCCARFSFVTFKLCPRGVCDRAIGLGRCRLGIARHHRLAASEVSRMATVSGTSPRKGTPRRLASDCAPPWAKMSVADPQ